MKLCECGCGSPVPIARKTSTRDGYGLTELESMGEERKRLLRRLEALRDDLRPAIKRARDSGATIAECARALQVSPQALHKLLGQIPNRNG